MQIAKNSVVSIEYTLTNPAGDVLDKSEGRGPLVYLHGARNIIPGLEAALEGKSAGESLKVTIEPEQAYGAHNAQMQQVVPRAQFPANQMIMVGQQFQATGPNGQQFNVRVAKVSDTEVTMDANHPLAGVPLTFDVKVVDVREATAEEQQHGHAHGPGGHAH
jgi:FKBP-type peptidyl-prolyl cis-trans isomerase SlyD